MEALKTYVTDNLCQYYGMVSIRTLMKKNGQNKTLEAHQLMESTLDKERHVVGYFSCGTGSIDQSRRGVRRRTWLGFLGDF